MRPLLSPRRPAGFAIVARVACLALVLATIGAPAQAQLFTNTRWSNTATDGSIPTQGDPTTLTWSLIPDGTTSGNGGGSDLIDFFDGLYGDGGGGSDLTDRPWFFIFEQPFARYNALSGLNVVYEPNDDGVRVRGSNTGILGVRGDVRIGGDFIDGNSSTLAFASFPNNGDITIDTGDSFYNSQNNNSLATRNVVSHEFGHSIGMAHVESNNARFLMEPFISTQFDGPQLYDILALHRLYGDVYEKSNNGQGNETAGNATSLGTLTSGVTTSIGTDADNFFVSPNDTDFISIDDNNDTDFLSFTISSAAMLDLTLAPVGPSFNIAPQGESQNFFDASAQSDLALTLFDTDGTTALAASDTGGVGDAESILGFRLDAAGTYFARITTGTNLAQLFQLDLLSIAISETPDLNDDGFVGAADLDILLANWGGSAGSPALGDANGDGSVNQLDLDIVTGAWGEGTPPSSVIPEPGALALLGCGGLALLGRRRRA